MAGAGPTTRARASWVADRVTALPEMWALVALHLGLVGAWQLMLVCKAARVGTKDFLKTLPQLVVCGGDSLRGSMAGVWLLDLATLRWEAGPDLASNLAFHACCMVRSTLVVLGGQTTSVNNRTRETSRVATLSQGAGAFTNKPPLSCGEISDLVAIAVDEKDSAAGQVLLLGGFNGEDEAVARVYLVDLGTGVCTPQPSLLHERYEFTAARLPDGRVICAGGSAVLDHDYTKLSSVEVFEPPAQGALNAAWTWRELLPMGVARAGCRGCVLSDGRFAVLGGRDVSSQNVSSCEALSVGGHWKSMSSMHDARYLFASAAVAGCVVVAGGIHLKTAEVYDEGLERWLRLPYDLPFDDELYGMGSALL